MTQKMDAEAKSKDVAEREEQQQRQAPVRALIPSRLCFPSTQHCTHLQNSGRECASAVSQLAAEEEHT